MFFFFNDTATTEIYTLSLHDALPIYGGRGFDEIETELERGWTDDVRSRYGEWDAVRGYVEAGFNRRRATSASHGATEGEDRKSTRLNSSHANISYAGFCLKKKNNKHI